MTRESAIGRVSTRRRAPPKRNAPRLTSATVVNLDDRSTVVVVGASLAGLRAVEEARALGFGGRLIVVGAEPHLPYDRPPLSKQVLAGEWDADRTALRSLPYDDLAVDWHLGRRAAALNVADRVVLLADGERLGFDACVLATGAVPRTLPETPPLAGIHVLLTLAWFALLVALTIPLARFLAKPRVVKVLDRLAGLVFVGFGARLAVAHRG